MTATDMTYSDEIKAHLNAPAGPVDGVCPACHTIQSLTQRHDQPAYRNKYGITQKAYLLAIHGPRENRCEGSRQTPVPWMDVMGLPTWDDMTDFDKGAALMFLWKCHWEHSYAYARENYPARYINDPRLVALGERSSCRHASHVAESWNAANDRLGDREAQRLYDLALHHERTS